MDVNVHCLVCFFFVFFKKRVCLLNEQHAQWRSSRDHLVFKAFDATNHPLSSSDIGAFVLAIVELRCIDVAHALPTFSRVRQSSFLHLHPSILRCDIQFQTYWMEALGMRPLSSHAPYEEELIEMAIDTLRL